MAAVVGSSVSGGAGEALTVDVAIVGGGVSGLCAARAALAAGCRSLVVLEARDRLGGRAWSAAAEGCPADMGAAWVWQEDERLLALAEELGVKFEPQFGKMVGSSGQRLRFVGCSRSLVERLAAELPPDSLRLGSAVRTVVRHSSGGGGGSVELSLEGGGEVRAHAAVLAMPPQLAERLEHKPELPADLAAVMRKQPTFYATAAKACITFDVAEPFWRSDAEAGTLPTSAVVYEVYDSTSAHGGRPCLAAFVDRAPGCHSVEEVREHLLELLAQRYGDVAKQCVDFEFVAWGDEARTTADATQPRDLMPDVRAPLALEVGGEGGGLFLAGTETSQDGRSLGKLESAIIAGERAGRLAAERCLSRRS